MSEPSASAKIYVEERFNLGRTSFTNVIKLLLADLINGRWRWVGVKCPDDVIEVTQGKSQIVVA